MKKQLIIAALAVATSVSAFAQGYVSFASTKAAGAWYGPNSQSPGSAAVLGNNGITVGFMWAAQGSVPLVGSSGSPTASNVTANWNNVLTDPAFHFATNGSSLASVAVNNSGLAQGGWGYLNAVTFPLAGSTAGASYTFIVVAWNSAYATPQAAAAANSFLGWSNPFTYATAPDSGSAASTFALSGQTSFGVQPTVAPVPEPATFALAGLGAAVLLVFRRRK